MGIDIGLSPIVILLLSLLVLAILCDFLGELYSIRMSQASGPFQVWLFDHVGQNVFLDVIIAILFQFVSFRKKGFLIQFSSLVNVGSFTSKQCYMILVGSFIGFGLSALFLLPVSIWVGVFIGVVSFILSLFWKDQLRDVGVALLGLGMLLTLLALFDQYLVSSTLNIQSFHITEVFALSMVVLSTLVFRTPLPFFLTLATLHFFFSLQLVWFPVFYFVHSLLSTLRFDWQFFQKRQRLYPSLLTVKFLQFVQLTVSLLVVLTMGSHLQSGLAVASFVSSFQLVVVGYIIYSSCSLILCFPLLLGATWLPYFNNDESKINESQKIIHDDSRGHCFSIHLSLFLLRQEFKKYTASVHTAFKLSRESNHQEEAINQRFVRYQGMLDRVGDELKELCFNIGRQRSYRWQVKEVMSYYRFVNQLELLVEDLAQVAASLRREKVEEDYEKECRFWLGLQLKLFESFFNYTVGVGKDDPEKVQNNIDKSYEILDRFFSEKQRIPSKTFYRITESIGNLAL